MVSWHYHFTLLKYFIQILPFTLHLPPLFSIFDYDYYFPQNSQMFGVGLGNLKHTYVFV